MPALTITSVLFYYGDPSCHAAFAAFAGFALASLPLIVLLWGGATYLPPSLLSAPAATLEASVFSPEGLRRLQSGVTAGSHALLSAVKALDSHTAVRIAKTATGDVAAIAAVVLLLLFTEARAVRRLLGSVGRKGSQWATTFVVISVALAAAVAARVAAASLPGAPQ